MRVGQCYLITVRLTTAIPSNSVDGNLLQCVLESVRLEWDMLVRRPAAGEEARQTGGGARPASAPRPARARPRRAATRLCNTTPHTPRALRTIVAALAKSSFVTFQIGILQVLRRRGIATYGFPLGLDT
ncbi:unnamed protein product [Chrysodeixis includens]|uniref:Uncharacterized protein n=1 Tax=Chrysodeixis includens TaxID=689277 RepID=A0A9N8Q1E1_CHRIL|nr:unnamed protein product [Chrysodeixis includens]